MKRNLLLFAIFVLWSVLSATAVRRVSIYRTNEYNSSLSRQICAAIAPRVQVGAIRDAFDQAHAIQRISGKGPQVFLTLKDGHAEYGRRPPMGHEAEINECRIEGRPDFLLTFFFERSPFFGKDWILAFFLILLATAAAAFIFHVLSMRFVCVAEVTLSESLEKLSGLSSENSPGSVNKLLEKLLSRTSAITRLKSELEQKSKLVKENSSFQEEVSSLLASNSKFLEQERGVANLVQKVRHDLRSPLSFLKVFGQTLKGVENADSFHLSVQKIEAILGDLNAVAGTEVKGNGELTLFECAIHEIISAKKLAWSGKVDISFRFDSGNLNLISANPQRFCRIIDNLLQNALEATPFGGKIEITAKRLGERVSVAIRDTGRGIPTHILERLGKERLTFGKANGNGIGLISAKEWIEAWGGVFSIDSKEGSGTTIAIEIPRTESPVKFIAELPGGEEKEVVVVDDEENYARELISKSGRGQHFASIPEYVKWLESADLSREGLLSVYDLHLNPGSGLDLLRLHPWPESALLYTQDYLNQDALELAAELGFSILPKPFLRS